MSKAKSAAGRGKSKQKRARYKVEFWLDAMKDDDLVLLEEIDAMKRERTFTPTLRDALKLMLALKAGRAEVLEAMFPELTERLYKTATDDVRAEMQSAHDKRMKELQGRIDALDMAVKALGSTTINVVDGGSTTPKKPARISSDDLNVSIFAGEEKVDATEARNNFRNSLSNLFDDDDDEDLWA